MTSLIDATKPVYGNPTTASVRANFSAAYTEITDLQAKTAQAPFLPIAGGTMNGAITMQSDPVNPLEVATKRYIDNLVFGGGSSIPEAPTDGMFYARGGTTGGNTWSKDPLFVSAHFGPNNVTDRFNISSDATYNFIKFSTGNDFFRFNRGNNAFEMVVNNVVTETWSPTTGITVTSPITLPGNPASNLQAATKQYVDAIWTGGTFTGDIFVNKATPTITLQGTAGTERDIVGRTGTSNRWAILLGTGQAESGSNAGSNFYINRYADNGTYLNSPLTIDRATGNMIYYGTINTTGDLFSNTMVYGGQGDAGRVGIIGSGGNSYIYLGSGNNRRWILQGSDKNLIYYRDDNTLLFTINNGGDVSCAGSFTAGVNINATNGRITANNFMNNSGVFYVASDTNYYLSRSGGDGYWRFVEGGVINFTVRTNGDTDSRGTSWANAVISRGSVYASNDTNFYFGGTSHRYFQFAASWFWDWDGANGNLFWNTYSGWGFVLYGDRTAKFPTTLTVEGTIVCSANSIGVRYDSGAYSNGHNFLFAYNNVIGSLATASINNGGAVYALANASDARIKMDIEPSKIDALDIVNQLNLVSYDWLDVPDVWGLKRARNKARKSKLNPRARIGMIAQEIYKVFPEGVFKGDDFEDRLGRVWSLDQNNMLALCMGAIKQLAARVVELEGKI